MSGDGPETSSESLSGDVAGPGGAAHLPWVTHLKRRPVSEGERRRDTTRVAAVRAGVPIGDPDLAMRILDRAVTNLVGPDAPRRPGQIALTQDIVDTLRRNPQAQPGIPGGRLIAAASTGVGKTSAQLAPACAAALAGQRTVISTQSLSLQAQILDKDGPAMLNACEQVTGIRPTIAVHKGWSNFACLKAAMDTGLELVGSPPAENAKRADVGLADLRKRIEPLATCRSRPGHASRSGPRQGPRRHPEPGVAGGGRGTGRLGAGAGPDRRQR